MKKIVEIALWGALLIGMLILLSFVEKRHGEFKCKGFQVNIDYSNDIYFLTEAEIKKMVYDNIDYIENLSIAEINIDNLEELIESNNYVQHAEVYATVEGIVRVDIKQRKPIMRFIDRNNMSFYVDQSGCSMPLKPNFSARVLVINGHLETDLASLASLDLSVDSNENLSNTKLLKDAYTLGTFITNHDFWNAMIDQVYVNSEGEFELIPKIGKHIIIFGAIKNMELKFKHLLAFYKNGMGKEGWNKYKSVNVKYKNQIVCKKIKNE